MPIWARSSEHWESKNLSYSVWSPVFCWSRYFWIKVSTRERFNFQPSPRRSEREVKLRIRPHIELTNSRWRAKESGNNNLVGCTVQLDILNLCLCVQTNLGYLIVFLSPFKVSNEWVSKSELFLLSIQSDNNNNNLNTDSSMHTIAALQPDRQ